MNHRAEVASFYIFRVVGFILIFPPYNITRVNKNPTVMVLILTKGRIYIILSQIKSRNVNIGTDSSISISRLGFLKKENIIQITIHIHM
ncbi:hypothetical protein CsatB_008287 [Cannabis sativa]